jgi:YggT family protein
MIEVLCLASSAFVIALLVRMVLSWFPSSGGLLDDIQRVLMRVTEPVLAPVRRVLPPLGGLDLSPLVVLLVVQIVVMGVLGCRGPL